VIKSSTEDSCKDPVPGPEALFTSPHKFSSITSSLITFFLEIDEERMQRVQENFSRLHLQANILIGDAAHATSWWSGKYYDAILADVPCSATGIIRRHPDILYLRRSEDIAQLQDLQRKIIMELWGLLKPGGRLLFVTCSIFPQEGELQLEWFVENLKDVLRLECLGQILPNEWHDGFYYGMLQKKR
jgi:16S rRNA (cytosine967-C5)-methyltransferase